MGVKDAKITFKKSVTPEQQRLGLVAWHLSGLTIKECLLAVAAQALARSAMHNDPAMSDVAAKIIEITKGIEG